MQYSPEDLKRFESLFGPLVRVFDLDKRLEYAMVRVYQFEKFLVVASREPVPNYSDGNDGRGRRYRDCQYQVWVVRIITGDDKDIERCFKYRSTRNNTLYRWGGDKCGLLIYGLDCRSRNYAQPIPVDELIHKCRFWIEICEREEKILKYEN